ncbi:MAG TPA: CAP domain-containing protein [Bacillota bacterium]|nr:CAP domain-containing protein [Bacillota bacterium]HOK67989.1 CAP domain-containing protein [Bacillota bacterium]HPP84535.1 CAP domain-containing protein [Bacillota bacterium]
MKRRIIAVAAALLIAFSMFSLTAGAATTKYTVVKGDSLWKISVRFHVGLDEVIAANPQIPNPNLIYPNQVITVPLPDSTISSIEKQVIDLVNNIRAKYGLPKLTENWELSRCARYKSQDMYNKGYFSHTSPTYGSPFDMMTAFGIKYRTAGENIAKGYTTAQAVVNGWMNSPGHRANILNASFTQIGVGYVSSGNIWTQMFIG